VWGGAFEGGFNFVVEHFVAFAVNDGLFQSNLERVVISVGAWGFSFPSIGVFAGV
jgi:hypothetical protein